MKNMREVIEYAERQGFKLLRQRKHYIIKKGTHTLSLSVSPSCPHAVKNALKDIERTLKEKNHDSSD